MLIQLLHGSKNKTKQKGDELHRLFLCNKKPTTLFI